MSNLTLSAPGSWEPLTREGRWTTVDTLTLEVPGTLEGPWTMEGPWTLEDPWTLEGPGTLEVPGTLEGPWTLEGPGTLEGPLHQWTWTMGPPVAERPTMALGRVVYLWCIC